LFNAATNAATNAAPNVAPNAIGIPGSSFNEQMLDALDKLMRDFEALKTTGAFIHGDFQQALTQGTALEEELKKFCSLFETLISLIPQGPPV